MIWSKKSWTIFKMVQINNYYIISFSETVFIQAEITCNWFSRRRWATIPAQSVSHSVQEHKCFLFSSFLNLIYQVWAGMVVHLLLLKFSMLQVLRDRSLGDVFPRRISIPWSWGRSAVLQRNPERQNTSSETGFSTGRNFRTNCDEMLGGRADRKTPLWTGTKNLF